VLLQVVVGLVAAGNLAVVNTSGQMIGNSSAEDKNIVVAQLAIEFPCGPLCRYFR